MLIEMLYIVIFQLIVVTIFRCFGRDLPSNVSRCSINDPEVGSCISKAANLLRPYIREGIKEIGIPSYDPLVIPYLEAIHESDLVNYTNVLHNYTIRGLENYDITDIQYDPETLTFKGKFQLDPLSFQAHYNFTGRVLFIPMRGNGFINMAYGPMNGTFEITGEMTKLKNLDHYKPKDVKIRLMVDDMSAYLDGLFDGDLELATRTNDLINQNSRIVTYAITPIFEGIAENLIMRYFKWLTKTFPYYELFDRSYSHILQDC